MLIDDNNTLHFDTKIIKKHEKVVNISKQLIDHNYIKEYTVFQQKQNKHSTSSNNNNIFSDKICFPFPYIQLQFSTTMQKKHLALKTTKQHCFAFAIGGH